MDSTQSSNIEELILRLLDPSTTPEKALQLFDSPCFSFFNYKKEDNVLIFFAYIRFIVIRLPDGCVSGIWEDILKNTIIYSKYFADSDRQTSVLRWNYSRHIYTIILPRDGLEITAWLEEVMSAPSKCPNPLIRLELLRLIRLLRQDLLDIPWNLMWPFFKHTITEIQPCHLYTSEDGNMLLFGIYDMKYLINRFTMHRSVYVDLYIDIPNITIEELVKKKQFLLEDKETRFICHCIRLIGIFTKMAFNLSESHLYGRHLSHCFNMLRQTLRKIVSYKKQLPSNSLTWNQFRELVYHSPYRPYVVETIQDLTEYILCKRLVEKQKIFAMKLRNIIAQDLGVCTNKSDLPRLLLSRQIQNPMIIYKHSLLLENLYTNDRSRLSDLEEDNVFDTWLSILHLMDHTSCESSDEATTSSESSNDSDY